jgi:phospholipase/carboxylesterase
MQKIGNIPNGFKGLEVYPSEPFSEGQGQHFFLFHGFGADAYDLQPLADVIQTQKPTHWIFPQGVLEVPIGPGWTGRAWWKIDVVALQQAAASGQPRDLTKERSDAVPGLREKFFATIKSMNLQWKDIILGGFSQGAMLATDLFLHAPEAPKALVVLSGALVNKEEWKTVVAHRAGSPFFQSHGKHDGVLALRGASQLESFLTQAGLKGHLDSFEGQHEIPMETIAKLSQFLKTLP